MLLAIGLPHEIAHGSLRMTLSDETTMEDIDYTVDALKKITERLRTCRRCMKTLLKAGRQNKSLEEDLCIVKKF